MGKKQSKLLVKEYKEGVSKNNIKFSKLRKKRIILIGPNGKHIADYKK